MKKIKKNFDLVRELKKLWNMKVMLISIVIGAIGNVLEFFSKESERIDNWGKNWDYTDHSII